MAKNKLYQCPYNEHSSCDMKLACFGCGSFLPQELVEEKFTSTNTASAKEQNGHNAQQANHEICRTCNGKGLIGTFEPSTMVGFSASFSNSLCPVCNGTGKLYPVA